MTADEFTAKHGLDWIKFQSTEMGQDFLTILETEHPARKLPSTTSVTDLGFLTNGSIALLNDLNGFEKLARIIRDLAKPRKPIKPEPPDRYTDPEV